MTTPQLKGRVVRFAAVGLDHAHVFGQIQGLLDQGCELVGVSSNDQSSWVVRAVRERWPAAQWADDPATLLRDPSIDLIITAAIPSDRAGIAIAALENGKDVIADKPGCVTMDELERLEKAVAESGRFWSVTFSERFEVRCAVKAGELVLEGRIGRVVQTLGLGPHREGDRAHLAGGDGRPGWFYSRENTGGIITDIGSHQIDQFLYYTGSSTAEIVSSSVANYTHPDSPKMQDFGELTLQSDTAHGYVRLDWYTPDGLGTWGDGRLIILGTEGFIELRKYVDIAGRPGTDHLFLVDGAGTQYVDCSDVELPYYRDLVFDVINRTETACPQRHTFEVMRLAITAQENASKRGFAQ